MKSALGHLLRSYSALLLTVLVLPAGAVPVQPFKTFYNFEGLADGAQPSSGLLLASDGNFYGTTSLASPDGGQTFTPGTVFRITPAGTLNTIYRFGTAADDGAAPSGGLVEGSDGNFYGVTGYTSYSGGQYVGGGTIFRLTPQGFLTTLYRFGTSANDGNFPQAGLVEGAPGDFYGTTVYTTNTAGLGDGNGTLFRITSTGVFTSLWTFGSNTTEGANPYGTMVWNGNDASLYGTTYSTIFTSVLGGGGGGIVFKFAPVSNAGTFTELYSFNESTPFGQTPGDGANPKAGLLLGSDGNYYGTTAYTYFIYNPAATVGNSYGSGTVFKITPAGELATLNNFGDGDPLNPYPSNGAHPVATLIQGTDGNFYGTTMHTSVVEQHHRPAHGTVFKMTPWGLLTTIYEFGTLAEDGTEPSTPLLEGPDGNFYGTTMIGGRAGLGNVFELVSPAIEFLQVSGLTSSGGVSQATLTITANPEGQPTMLYFAYGLTGSYGQSTAPQSVGGGSTPVAATASLTGLLPNTLYHYAVVTQAGGVTTKTADQTFTTSNAGSSSYVAHDDEAVITGRSPISINVLVNDTGPDGLPVDVTGVTQPLHGHVTVGFDNLITYTPAVNFAKFAGPDTFTYTLYGLSTATVTVGNPYPRQAGRFAGSLTLPEAGQITLAVTGTGNFTGALRIGAASHPLKGKFNGSGAFSGTVAGQSFILQNAVALSAAKDGSPAPIAGSYGGNPFSAYHATPYTKIHPAPEMGSYTMLLPAETPPGSAVPSGTGFATLKVNKLGRITLSGVLGDGTPFSGGTFLTSNGLEASAAADLFPIYASLAYAPRGVLSGEMTFAPIAGDSDFAGSVAWLKPKQQRATRYPNGFQTTLAAIGSRYFAPPLAMPVLELPATSPNATIVLSAPGWPGSITQTATVGLANKTGPEALLVTAPNSNRFTVAIVPRTGAFHGSFIVDSTSPSQTRTSFRGVVFQDRAIAAGYFVSAGQSGSVGLSATP